ncbi:MAG: hypothetical protein F2605_04770, partial [Actinobacteria bacterium]|nr:hypothetical protein [Actinomycetota bacterium]
MSSPRFGGFRRGGAPVDTSGTKATFGQLMPYLLEHKRILGVVIALSLLGAGASLGQPLIVA